MNISYKLLILAIGCYAPSVAAEPIEVIPPQFKVLSSTGPYVFGQISSHRKDQFMLDTETGRLWQMVLSEKNGLLLQAVLYKKVEGGLAIYPNPKDLFK